MASITRRTYGNLVKIEVDDFDTVTVGNADFEADISSSAAEDLMRELMEYFDVEDLSDKVEELEGQIEDRDDEIATLKQELQAVAS